MTSISAVPDLSAYAVTLTVTAAAGAYRVTAEPLGRPEYTVRTFGQPTTAPFADYAAPFGIPITYRVIEGTSTTAQVNATLDAVGTVLASTDNPALMAAVPIIEDRPHAWEARSAFFDVIGRPDPLVARDVMRYRSGSWAFVTANNDERAALISLVRSGSPVLLRTPCADRVDDAIALPLRMTEEPLVDETGTHRVFRIDYQVVTREQGPYPGVGSWTYADLDTDYATYDAVLADYSTYLALFAGTATTGLTGTPASSPLSRLSL